MSDMTNGYCQPIEVAGWWQKKNVIISKNTKNRKKGQLRPTRRGRTDIYSFCCCRWRSDHGALKLTLQLGKTCGDRPASAVVAKVHLYRVRASKWAKQILPSTFILMWTRAIRRAEIAPAAGPYAVLICHAPMPVTTRGTRALSRRSGLRRAVIAGSTEPVAFFRR